MFFLPPNQQHHAINVWLRNWSLRLMQFKKLIVLPPYFVCVCVWHCVYVYRRWRGLWQSGWVLWESVKVHSLQRRAYTGVTQLCNRHLQHVQHCLQVCVRVSVCMCAHVSVCMCVYMSVCLCTCTTCPALSPGHQPLCASVSVCMCVCLYVCPRCCPVSERLANQLSKKNFRFIGINWISPSGKFLLS